MGVTIPRSRKSLADRKARNVANYNKMLHLLEPYVKDLPKGVTERSKRRTKAKISNAFRRLYNIRYSSRYIATTHLPGVPIIGADSVGRVPVEIAAEFLERIGRATRRQLASIKKLRYVPVPGAPGDMVDFRGEAVRFINDDREKWYYPVDVDVAIDGISSRMARIREVVLAIRASTGRTELAPTERMTIAIGGGERGGRTDTGVGREQRATMESTAEEIIRILFYLKNPSSQMKPKWIHGVYVYILPKQKPHVKKRARQHVRFPKGK